MRLGTWTRRSLRIHDLVSDIREGGLFEWPVYRIDVGPRRGRARLEENDYRPKCAGQQASHPTVN
jgi:hypothetical protein